MVKIISTVLLLTIILSHSCYAIGLSIGMRGEVKNDAITFRVVDQDGRGLTVTRFKDGNNTCYVNQTANYSISCVKE